MTSKRRSKRSAAAANGGYPVGEERSDGKADLRNRVFCSSCGISVTRRHGLAPLGWQEMPDANDRSISLCPECVRRNLWLIEARLDVDPGADL